VVPALDLAEPSRILLSGIEPHCNFRCSFCSLTAEGRRFQHRQRFLERQLEALTGRHVVLIDNNFFGNDRRAF
jgi:radical SAM superfamily enzyme YgiQ (UPF0313 family)